MTLTRQDDYIPKRFHREWCEMVTDHNNARTASIVKGHRISQDAVTATDESIRRFFCDPKDTR